MIRILLVVLLMWPHLSHAIVPPDFIVTVSSNLLQILGIVSLAVFSIYSVIAVGISRGYVFAKKYALLIIFCLNLIAGVTLYYFFENTNRELRSFAAESETLQTKVIMAEERIKELEADIDNPHEFDYEYSSNGLLQERRNFISDTYVVVAEDVILELDINRLETEAFSNVYKHYIYLNGMFFGTPVTNYAQFVSTTSDSISYDFLRNFQIIRASDLSARDGHHIALTIDEDTEVQFSVPSTDTDFVTRNSPAYTRTHAVTTSTIRSTAGNPIGANVYIERTYSDDADTAIFFPGRNSLGVKTTQFILWDLEGNFYLYDKSTVARPVEWYKPHTWLLRKTKAGLAQKAYVGSHRENITGDRLSWQLLLTDFDSAEVTLSSNDIFKSEDGRLRIGVSGIITDSDGSRSVVGVAHVVD